MKTHMAAQPQSKTFSAYTNTQTKDGYHTVKKFFSDTKRTINKIIITVGT